jgi:hypothetical protein
MTKTKVKTFTDYEEFYDANEPDNAGEMNALNESVSHATDEEFYNTQAVNQGKIKYIVTGPTGDRLLLTDRSRDAFLGYIHRQHRKTEPELDIDEAAAFEYAINNPHS